MLVQRQILFSYCIHAWFMDVTITFGIFFNFIEVLSDFVSDTAAFQYISVIKKCHFFILIYHTGNYKKYFVLMLDICMSSKKFNDVLCRCFRFLRLYGDVIRMPFRLFRSVLSQRIWSFHSIYFKSRGGDTPYVHVSFFSSCLRCCTICCYF